MPQAARNVSTGAEDSAQESSAKVWQERIKKAKDDFAKRKERIELYRKYVRGEAHDDGAPGLVRTNLIYVGQATIIPHTYAKNPEISVSPTKAVGPESYKMIKQFAATLEIVERRLFVLDTKLKSKARSNLYSVMTSGEGWLKMLYQRDYATDPIIQGRIQDSQDNLKLIEKRIRDMKDPERITQSERDKYDLLKLIESLESQAEVVAAEGLVIDRVRTEDMLILDKTLFEFDAYSEADALAQGVWMSQTRYEQAFGAYEEEDKPTLFAKPTQDYASQSSAPAEGFADEEKFVRVWEIWHKQENLVKTIAEGMKKYCREPYSPPNMPGRWYPFYRWGWNFVDGSIDALEDVAMQKELADEYNRARTNFAQHRENDRPIQLVRGGGSLDQETLDRIQARKRGQLIVIPGASGQPISNDIYDFKGNPLDPAVYDTSQIRADFELVQGRGDAAAGSIATVKTATEADILQQGLASRSDYRRDLAEDQIGEMARAAAEILLQELTPEQVEQIAGPAYVWPQMSKDQIFNMVQIEIRAGSSGRPNKMRELENWEKLLPLMQQAIVQIHELRSRGQFELAEANIKLVRETLTRFDERIDIEEYFGPQGEEGQAQAQQAAAMQQQIQQMSQELEVCKKQLGQVDQAKLQQQQTDADFRNRELSMKEQDYARQAEERAVAAAAPQAAPENDTGAKQQEAVDAHQRELEILDRKHRQALEVKGLTESQAMLEQLRDEYGAQIDALEQKADDAITGGPVAKVAQVLGEEMIRIEQQLQQAEAARQTRAQAVANYLQGPRTPDTLHEVLSQLTGA